MKDYCKITNYPRAIPLTVDGEELLIPIGYSSEWRPFYQLNHDLWADTLALKRELDDIANQVKLDEEWALIDSAYGGNAAARASLRFKHDYGYKTPTYRIIEPSTEGLPSRSGFNSDELSHSDLIGFVESCAVCKTSMLVSNRSYRYCSPQCAQTVAKAKYDRANAKRPKVIKQEVNCAQCGKLFTQSRADAKLCSNACRLRSSRANRKA